MNINISNKSLNFYESKARKDIKESPIPSPAPRAQQVRGICPVNTDVDPACFESAPDMLISKATHPSASVTPF